MSEGTTRVGIVGLGRMGSAFARAVAGVHPTIGWDVRELPGAVVETVDAPVRLIERCDVLVCCLPSPKETRQVLAEESFRTAWAEALTNRDGPLVIDTSTSDPASLRALATELGAPGEMLLDAPILGRPDSCGAWTLPVGGSAEHVERVRPVLEQVAATIEHVGPLGSGHTIKLLNNMMFAAINVITAEVIGACERLDLDPARFVELVGSSAAATVSPLFRDLAPRMLGEARETVFTVSLLHKDLQLAARMCEDANVPLVSTRAHQIAVARAIDAGLGGEDTASLIHLYRGAADGVDS